MKQGSCLCLYQILFICKNNKSNKRHLNNSNQPYIIVRTQLQLKIKMNMSIKYFKKCLVNLRKSRWKLDTMIIFVTVLLFQLPSFTILCSAQFVKSQPNILPNPVSFHLVNETPLSQSSSGPGPDYDSSSSFLSQNSNGRQLQDCTSAIVTAPIFSKQTYTITQSPVIYQMPAWTVEPPECIISYSIPFSKISTAKDDVVTFDPKALTFTYYETNISLAQLYPIIEQQISAYIDGDLKLTSSIFLKLLDPCLDATRTSFSLKNEPLPDYNFLLSNTQGMEWTHDSFISTHIPIQTEPICGDFTYTASMDGIDLTTFSNPLNYDSKTQAFSLWSEDENFVGAHEITLTGYLSDYPTGISKDYTFTLNISSPCLDETLTFISLENEPLPDQSYNLFDNSPSGMQWTHDSFITTHNPVQISSLCGDFTYTASAYGNDFTFISTPLSYDSKIQTFSLYTEDVAWVGAHEITLTGQYINYPDGISKDYTFTLNISNPCLDATLTSITMENETLPDQSYNLFDNKKAGMQWTHDSFVSTHIPVQTSPICGDFTYTASMDGTDLTSTSTPLSYDTSSQTFTLYSQDVVLVGDHLIILTGQFTDYPTGISKDYTFTLNIQDPCLDATLTSISMENETLPDQSYNILSSSKWGMEWTHDSFVSTHIPVQTSPICGDFTYTASMDGNDLTTTSTPLSYDTVQQTFYIYTQDEIWVGAHEIILTGKFIAYPNGISKDYTFTLNIYPECDRPVSLSSDQLEIQEYTITEDTLIYTLPPFIADPTYCKITYSSNGKGPFTFDSDTATFTFPQNDDMSLVGRSYSFKINGKIGDVSASKILNRTFTINILSPCAKLSYLSIEPTPLPEGMSYTLFDYSFATKYEFQHEAFIVIADPIYLSLCGQISYTATFNGIIINSVSTSMSYNAADRTFGLYQEDAALIGIREISVQAYLVDDINVRSETLFTEIEIVDPCLYPDLLSIIIPNQTNPPKYLYTGSTPSLNFTPIPAVMDPYICLVDAYSCEYISGPIPTTGGDACNLVFGVSSSTFEPTNGSFTFSSIDIQSFPPGTYVIEITATVTSAPKSESFRVDIILEDPCPTVKLGLQVSPFFDQEYVLGQLSIFQPWQSNLLIQPQTQIDCGEVSVEFYLSDGSNSAPDPAIFQDNRAINNEFVTLYSENQSTAGSYSFLYKVTLLNYQTNFVKSIQPFTITVVDPCNNAIALKESAALVDQSYTITEAAVTYQVPKFLVDPPFCGITYSAEVDDIQVELMLSFDADSDVRTFTFHNQEDLILAGDLTKVYLVTVKAQTGAVISTALTASSSYNLILKNPCIDSNFVNIQISDLPVGIEYALYQRYMSFTHDAFSVVTLPIQHSLCGSLSYLAFFEGQEINPTSSPIAYDSLEFYVYSQDLSLIGTRIIQVGAYLSAYPETKSPEPHQQMEIEFINPCNDPNSLIVPDQINPLPYLYTSNGAQINVTPFIAGPPVCPITYECISVSGEDIDFKCNDPGVVSFDEIQGTMTFNTPDMVKFRPGSYEITIRGTVGIEIKISKDVTFTLVLENPCPMSQLQGMKELAFGDMVYILGEDQIEMSLNQSELVELDTRVDCGPIDLEFLDKASGNVLNTFFFSTVIELEETFFRIVEQIDDESVGAYQIHCRAFLKDYPEVKVFLQQPFEVTIKKPATSDERQYYIEPQWLKQLEDQSVILGENLQYMLGSRKDERKESQVFIEVNSQIKSIVEYEPLNNVFIVNGTLTEPEDVGLWTVRVKLVFYENHQNNIANDILTKIVQVYLNSFELHIIAQHESIVNETEKKPDDQIDPDSPLETIKPLKEFEGVVIPDIPLEKNKPFKEFEGVIIPLEAIQSLQDFEGVVILESPKKMMNRPVPYVLNLSSRGILTISFDRLMKLVEDPKVIPPTKVAINYDIFNQDNRNRRNLAEEESGVWFEDLKRDELIHMMLIDALEVNFQKDPNSELPETQVTGFKWDLIGFSTNFLQIKLDFKNPEAVGSFQFKDYITVTFWGVQFFQDTLGIEMELGYQLKVQIQRQLDDKRAEQVEKITEIVDMVMFTACLILLFLLGINGRLLPTWVFFNSIQLIVYAALLSTSMPSNLHYFLLHYLNLIRMNPESLDLEMAVWQHESGQIDYELINTDDSPFSSVLSICGYKHAFLRNLMIVVGISLFLLITLAVLILVDCIQKRQGNRRCSAFICNFSVRFAYEFFLEICLSLLIHIASMQVMRTEYEAKVSITSWAVASLYLVAIIASIVFLVSRFWYGGPFVRQTYSPGSLSQSWWGIRSLSHQAIQSFKQSEEELQNHLSEKELQNHLSKEEPKLAHIFDDNENQGGLTERNLLKLQEITPNKPDILTNMEENNFETDRKPKPFDNIICEGGEPIQANISIQFRCGLKNEARMRNKIAERVQVSNFYRTLFYGLKWNHEHNVAMVNPLAFVLRRVLYALVIVFMADQNVLFSALIILVTCLITLVFVVQEGPWEDRFINWQHFFNEIVFYFVCVGLMCFSGILTESEPSLASGWLLIGLILSLIAYNIIIILYDLCIYHRLFILRYFKGHIAAKANQRRNRRLRTKKNKILIEKNGDQKCKKLSLSSSIDDDILKIPLEQSQPASIILSKYSDKDLDTKEFNLPLLVNPKPQQKPIIEEICFEEDIINQGPDTAIKIIEEADYEAFESKPDLKNEIDFDDNLKLNGSQDDAGDNNKVVALSQSYGQFDQPDVGNSEGAEDKKCNGNQDDAEDNNKFVASSQSYNQFDQPDVGSSKGKEDHQVMQTINQDKQIGAVEQEPQLGQLDSLESLGKSSVEMVAYGQSQRNKYGSEGLYGFENDTDQGDNLNELNESPHIQFNRSTDDLQELPYTNQKDLNDLPFKMQFHKSSDDINEPTYSIKETPGFRKKMDAPRIGGYTDARVPHENSLLKRTMTAESNAAQNYGNALEVPKKAKFTSGQRFQKAAANNFFGGKKESVDNTAMDMDKISAKRGSQDSVSNQAVGLFDQKKLARSVSMRVMKEDKLNGGLARQKGVKFLKAKGGSLLTKRASLAQAGSNILN